MLFTIYYESFSFGNDWLGLRTVKLHACVRKCILGQPEKVRAVALAVPLHMDTRRGLALGRVHCFWHA